MKRYIRSASDKTYQNKKNSNKFIETRKYDDGHTVARQYMKWDTPNGEIKNYTGAKDAKRGRYHRANKNTLDSMLEDYDEIETAYNPYNMTDEEYDEYFESRAPDYMKTDAWKVYEDSHYDNGTEPWKVYIGFDNGVTGPASQGWELVYAPSAAEAERIVEDAYAEAQLGFDGCHAESISDEELQAYIDETNEYEVPFL